MQNFLRVQGATDQQAGRGRGLARAGEAKATDAIVTQGVVKYPDRGVVAGVDQMHFVGG